MNTLENSCFFNLLIFFIVTLLNARVNIKSCIIKRFSIKLVEEPNVQQYSHENQWTFLNKYKKAATPILCVTASIL